MADPVSLDHLRPAGPVRPAGTAQRAGRSPDGGPDFAALIKEQLQKVSRMQSEADEQVQQLLTGRTHNLTEVFTTARKAEIAFSLLMEIRNKLIDAYEELKNMRV